MFSRTKPSWRKNSNASQEKIELLPQADGSVTFVDAMQRVDKEMPAIMKALGQIERTSGTSSIEFAILNDMLLRLMLQFPQTALRSESDRALVVDKVFTAMRGYIAKKHPGSLAILFGNNTESLRSSLLQLMWIVCSEREQQRLTPDRPEALYATCVSLDVDYGVDLMAARGYWNKDRRLLIVQLNVWQAKASRSGLSEKEVRDVAQVYAPKLAAFTQDTQIDPDWLHARAEKKVNGPLARHLFDGAMNNAAAAIALIGVTETTLGRRISPYDRFVLSDRQYRLSQVFPPEVPKVQSRPVLHVAQAPVIRYLLDTDRGRKILSQEEAGQWPKPVPPPAPKVVPTSAHEDEASSFSAK